MWSQQLPLSSPVQCGPGGPGEEVSSASAADLLEQGHHGEKSLDVLDLVPECAVNAPELHQQAQQLCIPKPLEEVSQRQEGNQAAGSSVLRP